MSTITLTKKELNQILEEFVEQFFVEQIFVGQDFVEQVFFKHSRKEIIKTSKETIQEKSDVESMNFELFSDEIIVHILQYVPIKSIIKFSETSKRFHNISFEKCLWKHLFKGYYNTVENENMSVASPHSHELNECDTVTFISAKRRIGVVHLCEAENHLPQSGDLGNSSPQSGDLGNSSPQSGDSYIDYYKKYREYLEFTSRDIIGISDYYDCYIDLERTITLFYTDLGITKKKVFFFGDVIQISTGENYVAIIRKEEGKSNLYTWGHGERGALGHGNEKDSLDIPIKVQFENKDPDIKQIICVEKSTVALTESGNIYIWGDNIYQKIGTTSLCINKPRLIKHEKKFIQISFASVGPLAAISTEGKLYLWGKMSYSLTGLEQKYYKPSSFLEIKIEDEGIEEKVKQVKCGEYHVLALTYSNKVFSLGRNSHGQLGLDCNYALIPKKVVITTNDRIKQISCGSHSSAILTWTGKIFFFGSNYNTNKRMSLPKNLLSKRAIYMFFRKNRTGVVFNDFTATIFGGDGFDEFNIKL